MTVKANDQPCPYPANFIEGPPLDDKAHDIAPSAGTLNEKWPPKAHGEASDELYESIWNVPDGRRK